MNGNPLTANSSKQLDMAYAMLANGITTVPTASEAEVAKRRKANKVARAQRRKNRK